MMMRISMFAMGLAVCVAGAAQATPASEACHVFSGGQLWLPSGLTDGMELRVEGAEIAVGPAGSIERDGCEVNDVSGKIITPGFIEPNSRMGLVEVELESHTDDSSSGEAWSGDETYRASFEVWRGVNPRSQAIPVTRVEGVSSAIVVPGGGLFSGQAAWIDLKGKSQADMVRNTSVAMVVRMGAQDKGSRALSLHRLHKALGEARQFRAREDRWLRGETPDPSIDVDELKALYPVLDGKLPVLFYADRASDLENIANVAHQEGFSAVVVGGAEAWLVAETLSKNGVSVVIDPLLATGRSFDQLHGRPDNGRLLREAGVRVLFSSFETHNARTLRQVAGNAVREGMTSNDAMRAITIDVADAFQMSMHGRLASGARANFVVWSGDPFELSSVAEDVWIGGTRMSLETRQTLLRDKYIQKLGLSRELQSQ